MITKEELLELVDCARLCPSSVNAQPLKYYLAWEKEETRRILADKAYLEGVYRAGAEKASRVADRTLRKVYKKLGFVAR